MATPSTKEESRTQGQLNAVYACYGWAVAQGQFLEDAVRKLLVKVSGGPPPSDRLGLENLISTLREQITVTDTRAWKAFHTVRKERNRLIHQFFRNKEDNLKTEDGRLEMLMELVSIGTSIQRVADLLNGMTVAVDEALKKGQTLDEDIVFSLSDEVEKNYLPPFVRPNQWCN